MDDEERERIATYWLEKYGEPIDCPELLHTIRRSKTTLDRFVDAQVRLDSEIAAVLAELVKRLSDAFSTASRELKAIYARRSPGSAESPGDWLRSHAKAARREGREPARPFPFMLLMRLRRKTLAPARRIAETAHTQAESSRREPPPKAARKIPDHALALACYRVAEWIRARHRDRSGVLDGHVAWGDVVRCLEWHGHDLGRVSPATKARNCRRAAEFWRDRSTSRESLATATGG